MFSLPGYCVPRALKILIWMLFIVEEDALNELGTKNIWKEYIKNSSPSPIKSRFSKEISLEVRTLCIP